MIFVICLTKKGWVSRYRNTFVEDIRNANVDVITIGQYLQPTRKHLPVKRFVELEEFEEYRLFAENLGFRHVESSPLVRSSYHAEKHIH